MNDERIIKAMAAGVASDRGEYPPDETHLLDQKAALAALRADGFDLYRTDEAIPIECPVCEGGTEVTHDEDCDICADPDRWTEHVEDCPRCKAQGEIQVVPVSEGTEPQ